MFRSTELLLWASSALLCTSLRTDETATLTPLSANVSAIDLSQLADGLRMDRACLSQPFPPDVAFQPGDRLVIPLSCCRSSCDEPLCIQRVECNGQTTSAAPTASTTPAGTVFITAQTNAETGSETTNLPNTTETDVLQDDDSENTTLGSLTTVQALSSSLVLHIDGSDLSMPAGTTTITKKNGVPFTLGPAGIIADTTTIQIPSSATTVSIEALGFTFKDTKGQPTSAIPNENQGDSASGATQPATITSAPSRVSTSEADVILPSGRPSADKSLVFNDQTYILPRTGSMDLLQLDGSTVTLFPDSVAHGSETAGISASPKKTMLTLGTLTLDVGPIEATSAAIDGSPSFGNLVTALNSLASEANDVVSNLEAIDEQGTSWASGSMTDSSFSRSVGGLFDDVVSQVTKLHSELRSQISQYNSGSYELHELTEDGQRRVFEAWAGAKRTKNVSENLRSLIRSITSIKSDVHQKVASYWLGSGSAIGLAIAAESIRQFAAHNWDAEMEATSSTMSATNSTQTFSRSRRFPTRTATTTSSTLTSQPSPYLLSSKEGTEPAVFEAYLKTLPGGGEGTSLSFPSTPWQDHITNLTEEQAEQAAKLPFMYFVSRVTAPEPDDEIDLPSMSPAMNRRAPESFETRGNSDQHLRVISTGNQRSLEELRSDVFSSELPDYLYDPLLGKGQTIYIIDAGFNVHHSDLLPGASGRTIRWKSLPNSMTLPQVPEHLHAPEDISSYGGHGTHVASIAGGLTHGVASNANLVLVKQKNAAKNELAGSSGRYINRGVTDAALTHVWNWITDDVKAARDNGFRGKSIVSFSGGKTNISQRARTLTSSDNHDNPGFDYLNANGEVQGPKSEIMKRALYRCWALDIITVVAAGNDGMLQESGALHKHTPQNHGKPNNALITVGSVDERGVLVLDTSYDRGVGFGGSLTVYAVGKNVRGAGGASNDDVAYFPGTSQASAAVAGLAAYFASLPSLADQWRQGTVAGDMKKYIRDHAYQRSPNPIPPNKAEWRKVDAESIRVAYNRAPDGLCAAYAVQRRSIERSQNITLARRQDSAAGSPVIDADSVVAPSLSALYCEVNTTATRSRSDEAKATTMATSASSVGTLSDLPTLTSASYCTEILPNGLQVLHTKTQDSCLSSLPPNSIRCVKLDGSTLTVFDHRYLQYSRANRKPVVVSPSRPSSEC